MYHGAVLWGVTWIVFAWLTTTALSFMIGGLFNAFGSGLQVLGQGVGSAVSTAASKAAGNTNVNVSVADIRKQVESILTATGKPELQPGEMKKDAGKVADQAQGGQSLGKVSDSALAEVQEKLAALDREAATNVLINKMGMSRTQAQEVVQSTIGAIAPIKDAAQNVKQKSVDLGNAAIDRLGSAAWWLFLGLISLADVSWRRSARHF
jgi:hypothetical protein